jgi:hypothetical protein
MKEPCVMKPETWALRLKVIGAFGGQCVDCGETDPVLLELDHINGGGNHDRKLTTHRGQRFYTSLMASTAWLATPPVLALRCVSCHRRKTWREWGLDTSVPLAGVRNDSEQAGTPVPMPVTEPSDGGSISYDYRRVKFDAQPTQSPAEDVPLARQGLFSRFKRKSG